MKQKRLPVGVNENIRAVIGQAGPVNPATRALILLGAYMAGLDLTSVMTDCHAAIGCPDLHAGVRAALVQIVEGGTIDGTASPFPRLCRSLPRAADTDAAAASISTMDGQADPPRGADPLLGDGDRLAGVGFDV